MGEKEIAAFLTHLAVDQQVAASTQNQALSALLFLYQQVLERKLGYLDNIQRVKRPRKRPGHVFHESGSASRPRSAPRFLPTNGRTSLWKWTSAPRMPAAAGKRYRLWLWSNHRARRQRHARKTYGASRAYFADRCILYLKAWSGSMRATSHAARGASTCPSRWLEGT